MTDFDRDPADCPASVSGSCLAADYGHHCDTDAGECVEAADTTPPVADPTVRLATGVSLDGPSVKEAADDDRRWDLEKAGE